VTRRADTWYQYTSDKWVLDMVHGLTIDLLMMPEQSVLPDSTCRDPEKDAILAEQIALLLSQGIIEPAYHSGRAFVSHMFLRPKSDGTYRPILNLSKLNECTTYRHFKMDHLATVMGILPRDSYMASIDITQAYHSIGVKERDRDLLQLQHRGRRFRFTCLPNGYSPGPRLFTRIMKSLMAYLREQFGVNLVFYIDDTLIYADNPGAVREAIHNTLQVVQGAGFMINVRKSVLEPTQVIDYLGFTIHSPTLTLTIPPEKVQDLLTDGKVFLDTDSCSVRNFSRLVGRFAATDPGNSRAKVHIKALQVAKFRALCKVRGDYEGNMYVTATIRYWIREWLHHLPVAERVYAERLPQATVYTDASGTGWGAYLKDTNTDYGEEWCEEYADLHINIQELLAVLQALVHYRKFLKRKHVHFFIDNTTALACLRKGGSTQSPSCNEVTEEIFRKTWELEITFQLTYVPTAENGEADKASRAFTTSGEWSLSRTACNKIFNRFPRPEIDLFASPLNAQCDKFVALNYYTDSYATDAFTMSWNNVHALIFPPFALIGRVLRKIRDEAPSGLLVVPEWKTQPWYPAVTRLPSYHQRLSLRVTDNTLVWPDDQTRQFPMKGKMRIICVPL
jgi:hypothetical protein